MTFTSHHAQPHEKATIEDPTAMSANPSRHPSNKVGTRQVVTSLVDELALLYASSTTSNLNPLAAAVEEEKNILLTLYAVFPRELPFALDLLDRGLVHCFHLQHQDQYGDEEEQQTPDRSGGGRLDDPDPAGLSSSNTTLDQAQTRCTELPGEAVGPDRADHQAQDPQTEPFDAMEPQAQARPINGDDIATTTRRAAGLYYVQSAQQHARSRYREENPVYYEVRLNAWSCSCPAFTISAFPSQMADLQVSRAEKPHRRYGDFGGVSTGDDIPVCKHLLACYLADKCIQFRGFRKERQVSMEELAGFAAGWGD